MAVFAYIALDERGAEQRGQVEAASERQAAQTLRRQSVYVVSLEESTAAAEPAVERGEATGLRSRLPVRTRDLVFLFQRLALMLRAGHTVVESLKVNQRITDKRRLKRALAEMAQAIRAGGSLSRALAAQSDLFPPVAHRMVEAGERSGTVDRILERLAGDLERRQDLRRELATALSYPTLVFCMALGVAVALVGWVIPRFAGFLASRDVALPATTQLLLDVADFVQAHGAMIGAVALVTIVGTLALYTTRRGKTVIDRALIRAPLVGPLVSDAAIAQACWTLSMQLRSGINLLASLRTVESVVGNSAVAEAFAETGERVLAGHPVSSAFPAGRVPALVRHMASVGERSGELDGVMDSLGEFYRKQLQSRVKTLTAWVEPALVLLVGGMVAIVYLAFFQAALRVSSGGI